MNARILPTDEWPRLDDTDCRDLWRTVNPENTAIIVVEDEGKIVATWAMLRVVHAHCLWVAETHRGSLGVARRLFSWMRKVAEGWGVDRIITGSMNPFVTGLIERFGGVPFPDVPYILPLEMFRPSKRKDAEIGAQFHAQLATAGIDTNHANVPEHDEAVGRALRIAVELGDPTLASATYNAWAEPAGFVPVKYLGFQDGRMRADIGNAVIEIDDAYRLTVLSREGAPCQ